MSKKTALSFDRSTRTEQCLTSFRHLIGSMIGWPNKRILAAAGIVVLSHTMSTGLGLADDKEVPVLVGKRAANAIVVDAQPRCAEAPVGMPLVDIRWDIDETLFDNPSFAGELKASSEARVDVTMYRDGFKGGRFESHAVHLNRKAGDGALARQHEPGHSVLVPNLRAAVNYTVRVLILTPDGWVASEEQRIFTPICPVDGLK